MINKSKKNLLLDTIFGVIPFVLLIVIWMILYRYRIVPTWILASPQEVVGKTINLIKSGVLLELISTSLTNVSVAFVIALILALLIGIIIGLNEKIKKIFFPFISFLYPIPSLAWLPLIIIIFGFTQTAIWIIVGMSAFFKMIFNVINGIRSVDRSYIWAARNLGFSGWSLIWKIILPAAFPHIITGIRMGFGSAWRSLIGAEIIVPAVGGLGSYIANSQYLFRFDQIMAGIIIIAIISYVIEKLVFGQLEEKILVKYGIIRY